MGWNSPLSPSSDIHRVYHPCGDCQTVSGTIPLSISKRGPPKPSDIVNQATQNLKTLDMSYPKIATIYLVNLKLQDDTRTSKTSVTDLTNFVKFCSDYLAVFLTCVFLKSERPLNWHPTICG